MDITLYKNFSVHNKLDKNITSVASYPGVQLVEATGDYDVSIKMGVATATLRWDNVNYFAFDGAYYFLEEVEEIRNSYSVVHGRMDLLMTYNAAVKQLSVLAERSTSHGSARLDDAYATVSIDRERTVVEFPNQIRDTELAGTYILTTAQSGYTID